MLKMPFASVLIVSPKCMMENYTKGDFFLNYNYFCILLQFFTYSRETPTIEKVRHPQEKLIMKTLTEVTCLKRTPKMISIV